MNDLVIPNKSEVPAYILKPEYARAVNEEASAGISTGMPARVKLSGKQFTLVDGNGEETPFPPAKLVAGPADVLYLPVIFLRAKKAIVKTWYASAFNPAEEGKAPDCFSNDGERPDPSALVPQCDVCAKCPQNAFGSGKDQAGNPTKGKACSDTKILAAFVPGFGVHSFKIPPASLKNFGLYVKQLSAAGIPLGAAKTLVAFDLVATFPVLVFKFGGFVPENTVGKLAELAMSLEVEEIVNNGVVAAMPATPQAAFLPPVEDTAAKEAAAKAEADAKAKADAAAKKKAAAEKKAAEAKAKADAEAAAKAAAKPSVDLDLGLDLGGTPEEPEAELLDAGGASDDDIAKALGL